MKQGKKESSEAIKAGCSGCHGEGYGDLVDEWQATNGKLREAYAATAASLEKGISALESRQGRRSVPLRARYDEISHDMQFVVKGGLHHNPQYGEAVTAKVKKNVDSLQSMIKAAEAGRAIIIKKPARGILYL